MGLPISPLCDRNSTLLAESQIGKIIGLISAVKQKAIIIVIEYSHWIKNDKIQEVESEEEEEEEDKRRR